MMLQMAVNNSEGWGILQITTHLFGEYMLKKKKEYSITDFRMDFSCG